jgi:signal transduction histidine kinase
LLAALEREKGRLRWYASQLDRTEADARQRIAAELHDGIAQALTGQRLLLTALRPRLLGEKEAEILAGAEAASAEAQSHVRAMIQELRPAELEARNLRELALRTAATFTERYGFRVECAELPANELPAATLGLLFQALRELLFNAYHHSRGTRVHIAGQVAHEWVRLEVHDDGVGFSRANVGRRQGSRGLGLLQLFERIESAGGSVELGEREGVASLVVVAVPVQLREPPAPVP